MKTIVGEIRAAFLGTLVLAAITCGVYPLVVYGVGQALFPNQANGSLIKDAHGVIRGSALIGQYFSGPKYFHPRSSSAGNGYDAANSSGSNLGPTSQKLSDSIKERVDGYRKENGVSEAEGVPADAVTASGSGLDPHISVRNAGLQTKRVAQARGISEAQVTSTIQQCTEGPNLGILGEPGVNVLKLNMALDQLK